MGTEDSVRKFSTYINVWSLMYIDVFCGIKLFHIFHLTMGIESGSHIAETRTSTCGGNREPSFCQSAHYILIQNQAIAAFSNGTKFFDNHERGHFS